MPSTDQTDTRLTIIRALLAQAEATTFPAEAETFTAKASELMARYAIDEALLWDRDAGPRSAPGERRIELVRPFVAQKAVLVHEVSQALQCRAIRLGRSPGAIAETISVVGYSSDLDLVELLVTSLLVQMTTAMTAVPHVNRSAAQVASWRRSFIMGFTETVATRLRAQGDRARRAADDEGSGVGRSTELVLADRSVAVESEFRRRFPRVRSTSISSGSSQAGRTAGSAAGRSADLGARGVGGHRPMGAINKG